MREVHIGQSAQKDLISANRQVDELRKEVTELSQALFREKQLRIGAESVL